MNKIIISLLFVLAIFCELSYADAGDQYLLPKLGYMSVDLNDADPIFSLGVLYGYGITSGFSVEGELNLGLSGGEYDKTLSSGTRLQGEYSIWTLAAYGVYRYSVTDVIFLKGKLGILYENIERDGTQTPSAGTPLSDNRKTTGFGAAGGLGVGFIIKDSTLEFEVTGIDEDIIFYSIGINYSF